ncbi:MAG: hypothetical protein ABJ327_11540 [Litoreibacter sp.]
MNKVLLCSIGLAMLTTSAVASTVIAFGDEAAFSNQAFSSNTADAQALAAAVLSRTAAGGDVAIIGSTPIYGYESSFASFLTTSGAANSVTNEASLSNIGSYDAIFLAGTVGSGASNAVTLQNYVSGGGSIVVSLGSGVFRGAAAEANAWNPLLSAFGMQAGSDWFDRSFQSIDRLGAADPTFLPGVAGISWNLGQEITLTADSTADIGFVGDFSNGPRSVVGIYETPVSTVPIPAGLSLLLCGLTVLSFVRRKPKVV